MGKFGVDNGIGYVKCQCPRCGAGLIVLDGDADDIQSQSTMEQVDELLRLREENLRQKAMIEAFTQKFKEFNKLYSKSTVRFADDSPVQSLPESSERKLSWQE